MATDRHDYDILQIQYPNGPTNRTDPFVVMDPSVKVGSIAKLYEPTEDEAHVQEQPQDDTRVDAIYTPLIKLNNRVIDISNISYFKLDSTGMLPSIYLVVEDQDNMIQFSDVPGLDNVITVVITPPNESGYKKIAIDFYITDCNFMEGMIMYNAVYKLLPLEDVQFKQVKFHHPTNGCVGSHMYSGIDLCGLGPNAHPTTYEFFHVIAEETGLGFARTQHVKEVKDDRYRLLSSEKYKDAISNHIKFSGTNETEMLDAWVDIYHYLVMVNVYWVLNEPVKPNELSIATAYGIDGTDSGTPKSNFKLTHRTLTNYEQMPVQNNLMFAEYKPLSDPGTNFENGTNNSYNVFSNKGYAGGSDQMGAHDIKQMEISKSGQEYQADYMFSRSKFLGFEMADMNPILKQTTLRNKYFEKLRTNLVKIQMSKPNLGLQRGMLTNVTFFEYDGPKKMKILAQTGESFGANKEKLTEEQKKIMADVFENEDVAVVNVAMSGMYYIDGLEFTYDKADGFIKQYLYLIKKGNLVNYDQHGNKITNNIQN